MAHPTTARKVRQKTLRTSIGCLGTGLHTGTKVRMTLHPAPPDSGVVFRRADLGRGAEAEIAARWSNVVDTRLCTTLGNGQGARVGTVEHLMAALCGCEIDNVVVEVEGDEIPVMDGSAAPFVFLIECAGIAEQDATRKAIEILRPIAIDDGEARVSLSPHIGFAVEFEIDFTHPLIARQSFAANVTPREFKANLSRARTFGFDHEIDELRAAGLARGGSLDNAVVVGPDRVLNADGLRYSDEFARHKALDSIGDLYLAGVPILGRFKGSRSGHRLNNRLLQVLFGRPAAYRTVELTEARMDAASGDRPALAAGD